MNLRKEITEMLNKVEGEEIKSAFILVSTEKNTAFLAGGEKEDLHEELANALVRLIKEDPVFLLVMAHAIDQTRNNKGEKVGGDSVKDTVKNMLDKITKH
jgi:hypothetical protein